MSIRRLRARLAAGPRAQSGFTLPEIVTVLGITSVLAAIAIPTSVSQRDRAAEMTIKTNLTAAAATIEAAMVDWRGIPPTGALSICFAPGSASPTNLDDPWPSTLPVATTCEPGTWTAVDSTLAVTDPELSGTVGDGITIQGYIAPDGSYCLDGTSVFDGAAPSYLSSQNGAPADGTCLTPADGSPSWVRATRPSTITPDTDTSPPEAPTDLAATVTAGVVTLTWSALGSTHYYVQISNNNGKTTLVMNAGATTCKFPGSTCAGPDTAGQRLPPGIYEATVRAGNDNGWGAPATVRFQVNNGN